MLSQYFFSVSNLNIYLTDLDPDDGKKQIQILVFIETSIFSPLYCLKNKKRVL